jgi:hypothetical protein
LPTAVALCRCLNPSRSSVSSSRLVKPSMWISHTRLSLLPSPEGLWTFIQDVSPNKACSRYFGSDVAKSLLREIEIVWLSPRDFIVSIDEDYNLTWQVSLGQTLSTSLINTTSRLIPNALYRNAVVLKLIARIGSLTLGAGRLSLTGKVPNGQRFISNPRYLWTVLSSVATLRGQGLGKAGPLPVQARLGDVWIPQSGRFFIGYAFLEAFDPARHLSATSRKG